MRHENETISLDHRYAHLVTIAARKTKQLLKGPLKYRGEDLSLSLNDYSILGTVQGKQLNQKTIARQLQINENVMVRFLDELENKKHIKRVDSPDRREKLIQITYDGENALKHANSIVVEAEDKELLSPLLEDERSELCNLLSKLLKKELTT